MTPTTVRILTFLRDVSREDGATGRMVARMLWPDSPAWRRMSAGWNGAEGKTMPAHAGALCWRLQKQGLVRTRFDDMSRTLFYISDAGRKALDSMAAEARD